MPDDLETTNANTLNEKPFAVEIRHARTGPAAFSPTARIIVSAALGTSGLLARLPAEEARTLMALLACVTPNGDVLATPSQAAEALGIPAGKARGRLMRLCAFRFRGEPLAFEMAREGGEAAFALHPSFLATEVVPPEEPGDAPLPLPLPPPAGREAVYAHVRAHYATPRAQVEREMAERNGWPLPEETGAPAGDNDAPAPAEETPEDGEAASARRRLSGLGLSPEEADRLLEHCGLEAVRRQLQWLPYRRAQNPARLLVASVEGGYGEPALLKRKRELFADEAD